jgi:signal transduction histidine kinase
VILNHFKNSVEANATTIKVYQHNLDKSMLSIYIEDNGNGIQKEIRKDIFTPNKSTKKKDVVTGNGMFCNKMIIEDKYGGKINIIRYGEPTIIELIISVEDMKCSKN